MRDQAVRSVTGMGRDSSMVKKLDLERIKAESEIITLDEWKKIKSAENVRKM